MSATILCASCGQHVPIPAGSGRSRVRCPSCGDLCPAPRSPVAAPPKALLEGTEEDDGKPYSVPGDPDEPEPCPNCQKPLTRGAIVCNHCGFNQETGTTIERVYQKVDRQWETGAGFSLRLNFFLAIQGLVLAATLVVAAASGRWFGALVSWLIGTILPAFLLGTFQRVHLTRNNKGKVRLTTTWYVCFLPLGVTDIRWREYEGVVVSLAHETDVWDWILVLFLLPWGVIPAIVWWYFIIEPDQFDVALSQDKGRPTLLLYRGRSEAMAKEIATLLRSVTRLS